MLAKGIVDEFLRTGLVDPQTLEEAIRVGVRRGKKPKTNIDTRKKAKLYYKQHKAEILKKMKQYRMKNKRQLAAYAKAYRKKFGEAVEDAGKDLDLLSASFELLLAIGVFSDDEELQEKASEILDEIYSQEIDDATYEELKSILLDAVDSLYLYSDETDNADVTTGETDTGEVDNPEG
ncbi:MAG: hypothetical protein N2053_08430 [Chitinispirillaceae bacterium]|nr:hypothetical protein [Chitinispirillaceae bacterium]